MKTTRFQKYIEYINNTGRHPLPVSFFDDDHEPIGQMVRKDMEDADLIKIEPGGIILRPDLRTWR